MYYLDISKILKEKLMTKLKQFVKEYNDDRVFYDPKFQRRQVWGQSNKNAFLKSVSLDRLVNPVALVEVERCLNHSFDIEDPQSIIYFQGLEMDGYRYVSIDGQNRTKTLIDFADNKCAISGVFKDADGNDVKTKNHHLSLLPSRLQDKFNDGLIPVKILPPCSLKDLASLFISTNSGMPLNAQEMRQAIVSPISDWVRETSKQIQKAISKIYKSTSRLQDDELVAKCAMILDQDNYLDLNKPTIDDYYSKGEGTHLEENDCPYKDMERVQKIIQLMGALVNNQTIYNGITRTVPKALVWVCLLGCRWAYDNDLNIKKYGEFFSCIKKIDDDLTTSSLEEYTSARKEKSDNGELPKDVSPYSYYFKWRAVPHKKDQRKKLEDAVSDELQKNMYILPVEDFLKEAV